LYVSHLKKGSGDFEHVRERALELLELAIEEVRTLSKAMVLPDLKKGGLVASIDDLVTDLRYSNLFEVDFSHSETVGLEEMNQSKKVTLFRIVQEQIKNILKYSQAGKVEMALHIQNNWVRLEVKDDGVGFDPEKIKRGLGLSNIYERARLYDGEVRLCAAPGKGCTMVVSMPLEKA
jgi:two-component system, NarL family, sensor histidine kinase UhpB